MTNELENGYVRSGLEKGVATIEFFHPRGNSLPAAILTELAEVIRHAGENDEARLILLRSAGDKTFCAGASFDELAAINNEAEGLAFFSGFAHVINAIRKAPKFVVARIQGRCVGGGVGLAAAADYAIAAETAEVKLSELAVGIGPFVVGPAVERKIGKAAFSHLAIDATMWRSADWARRKGLFSEVHGHIDAVDEAVEKLSTTLSASSPEAMQEMKRIFWEGTEHWDQLLIDRAAISGRLVLSAFTREAIARFKAK